ncbi:hypothetical protein SDJN03_03109, partial [Cucurbita argyrosperma subsp. sororia]
MASKLIKSFLLLLLLIFVVGSFSSGMVDPLVDVEIANNSIFKVSGFQLKARKLALDIDYDDPRANNRHDPKKPGNGKP